MLPDNLPHLCTLYKSAWLSGDDMSAPSLAGDDIDDPNEIEADRACWVQPASDREIVEFQRRSQRVTHTVYFRGNPSLLPGYIIIPADGPNVACPFTGATLEVRSTNETTAGLGVLWKAMTEEIQSR